MTQPSAPPFTQVADALSAALNVDIERGLTADDAARRLSEHGHNRLEESPPTPWWQRLAAQFQQLMVWILIAAAVIAGLLGDWTDTVAIAAIVILNGALGFFQEARAAQALEALRKMATPTAKVRRDGAVSSMPAEELVPGDVIELESGDFVPADSRLTTAFTLSVQESALTGESVPVSKDAAAVLPADTSVADRVNMVYLGTTVTAGKGVAVVTATGMDTELGHIAGLLQRDEPETTPLQRRLEELGRVLIVVCLAVVAVIFALQLFRGGSLLETLLLSVSLAVAAVPEGLPAVVTITLALGLQRMVRRNALVRKLPSVETLGSVTVICSDKTGTLTRNEMTVREIVVGPTSYEVTGAGYDLKGEIKPRSEVGWAAPTSNSTGRVEREKVVGAAHPTKDDLEWALTIGALCNTARIETSDDGKPPKIIGDPTEAALLVAARKHGLPADHSLGEVAHEIPFDSERKLMSIVVRRDNGSHVLLTKGAPDVLLDRCIAERWDGAERPLSESRRKELAAQNAALADQALRVLAFASREPVDAEPDESAEQGLVFAGMVGMIDPPREEAKVAVARCREAGIRPIMITGDHPATAAAIARELQIAQERQHTLAGRDLDGINEDDLRARVEDVAVYARVSPEHKLRVVKAWKQRGEIVAMTGDGVNDAPAVKAADIGIAMGITGTDVTKEASDMVLMDDNFASIVNAVEEGRGIFDNIQKFVHYLLACNAGEVLFMFLATLIGWPAPLAAIQVLWINLITDGIPALALALEPLEKDVMQRPPRPPRAPVISWTDGRRIFCHGLLIAVAALIGFAVTYDANDPDSLDTARTTAFCVMAYAQLFYALACRSPNRTMPEIGWFTNPALFGAIMISGLLQLAVVLTPAIQPWLETTAPPLGVWAWVLGLSLVPVTVVEVTKLFFPPERGA